MKGPQITSSSLVVPSVLVLISIWVIVLGGCGASRDQQSPPSPTQRSFVYTANGGSDDVSALKEDLTTGALSPATGSPFHAGDINENVPGVLTVDPAGRFLYVGDADSGGNFNVQYQSRHRRAD